MTETQTGSQKRRPEQRLDTGELRASLAAVHPVGDHERFEVQVRAEAHEIGLDEGEEDLWAHALLHRDDNWMLCAPDKQSLRFGIRMGFRWRLVSLEGLLDDIGYRPRQPLNEWYTKKWHDKTLSGLFVEWKSGP